ncbi:MAG: dihydrodipicolinate reductase [Clostridia bacterium]|nr:dihydrodipicolinate reductase [Clostridia bacterium]
MKKIKVVQYGCGKMSKYTMRYVLEKGMELVGAIDINPEVIGKDVCEIIGGKKTGVVVTSVDNAREMLKKVKPDACIVTTMSLMTDLEDALTLCAELGINAITTCEEAFFPMNSSPRITKKLDTLAKKSGCTITGSGYQDAFWGNLITTLAGATHKITKIKGSSSYNVEDYGIALAKAHGAGLSMEEFEKEVAAADNISEAERAKLIEKGEFLPSYMWNVAGWLADKLGLTITHQVQKCVPTTHTSTLHSDTLQMDVPAGMATGMSAVVTAQTKEGIVLECECIGKVYAPEDCDRNEWTVCGEPDTTLVITRPQTVELTCATIVNRIPHIIAAPNGYVPTSKMGEMQYINA